MNRFTFPKKAQVLLSTLLILLILSLLVVAIGSTVRMNSRQLTGNLQYSQSYNSSDNFVMQLVPVVTDWQLSELPNQLNTYLASVATNAGVSVNCEPQPSAANVQTVTCHYVSGTQRTAIEISDQQNVDEYNLATEEYINLGLGGKKYSLGSLQIQAAPKAVLEFTLEYRLAIGGPIYTATQLVNQDNNTYPTAITGTNLLSFTNATQNPLKLPLNNGNILEYLRIKNMTPDQAISLTITPNGDFANALDYPNQIRQLKAISYDTDKPNAATPLVITSVPINAILPIVLDNGANFQVYNSPTCGNNLNEAKEACDDGNASNNDTCVTDISTNPAGNCKNNRCGDGQVKSVGLPVEACDNGVGNGKINYPNPGQNANVFVNNTYVYNPAVVPPANLGCSTTNIRYPSTAGNINVPVSCNYCGACTVAVAKGPYCGDGKVDNGILTQNGAVSTEQCDAGARNGVSCTPGDGGTCTYCSTKCVTETVTSVCSHKTGGGYRCCPKEPPGGPTIVGPGCGECQVGDGWTCDGQDDVPPTSGKVKCGSICDAYKLVTTP